MSERRALAPTSAAQLSVNVLLSERRALASSIKAAMLMVVVVLAANEVAIV